MERARHFYGKILGLNESDVITGENGEIHWVEYDIQGQTLALAAASEQWQPHPQGGGVSLEVANLEAAIEHLKSHGIDPTMPIGDFPICRISLISDPDGNGIALHQRKSHHPDFSG